MANPLIKIIVLFHMGALCLFPVQASVYAMGRDFSTQENKERAKLFPRMFSLKRILSNWSPDIPYVPPEKERRKFDSLEHLDYQNAEDKKRALLLREAEIPFVVHNVPNLQNVTKKWKNEEYMQNGMGDDLAHMGQGYHNHFMFFAMTPDVRRTFRDRRFYTTINNAAGTSVEKGDVKSSLRPKRTQSSQLLEQVGYKFRYPPPEPSAASYSEFRAKVKEQHDKIEAAAKEFRSNSKLLPTEADPYSAAAYMHAHYLDGEWPPVNITQASRSHTYPHYYLTFNDDSQTGQLPPGQDIDIWRKWQRFFIVDPNHIRGMHCRYGMRGVVAEAHWDGHLNFIAILRGRKRYILTPPSECPYLGIMSTGPSRRHAAFDLSDPTTLFTDPETSSTLEKARGLETVLDEGDVLYVPSYWIHYIVSLHGHDDDPDPGINFQCSTRSGTSAIAIEDTRSIRHCEAHAHIKDEILAKRWWETSDNWHSEEEAQGLQELSTLTDSIKSEFGI